MIDIHNNQASIGTFKSSARKNNIDTEYYATQNYAYEQSLPWDFIEISPGKEFLIEESKRLVCQD